MLDIDHNLVIGKTRCDALDGKVFTKAGEDVAKILRAWLSDGEVPVAPVAAAVPVAPPSEPKSDHAATNGAPAVVNQEMADICQSFCARILDASAERHGRDSLGGQGAASRSVSRRVQEMFQSPIPRTQPEARRGCAVSQWEKPTASSLERCNGCPTSCAIPIRVSWTSEHARRGSELHGYIEAVLEGHRTREDALAIVPAEWRETAARLDWDALLAGYDRSTIHMESSYAIDTGTGEIRFLGRSLGRKYPTTNDAEIVGTSDIGGNGTDDIPITTDVKTGQPTTSCREN